MQTTLSLTPRASRAPLLRPLRGAWQALVAVSAVHTRIAYCSPWQEGCGTAPRASVRLPGR